MASNENMKEKAKEGFSALWKRASDFAEKTADSAKNLAEQTKQSIHDQKAKRYTPLTEKDLKAKSFQIPNIIHIVDDSANREYVVDPKAIGWIEAHKDIPVLHMYQKYAQKCGLVFVPVLQRDRAYYADNFDSAKYIEAGEVFGKSTKEKLAELNHIAFSLGAKACDIVIAEGDKQTETQSFQLKLSGGKGNLSSTSNITQNQHAEDHSLFNGHNDPQMPTLKWFAHDESIKNFIDQRLKQQVQRKELRLSGSLSATMSKAAACALDDLLGIKKGSISMEAMSAKEHSSTLIFRVEF